MIRDLNIYLYCIESLQNKTKFHCEVYIFIPAHGGGVVVFVNLYGILSDVVGFNKKKIIRRLCRVKKYKFKLR